MERPLKNHNKGDIVILPIPFTDSSESKRRPAIIIATPKGDNSILLAITSKEPQSPYGVKITPQDFAKGQLPVMSYVKTNLIFTIANKRIIKKAGTLHKKKTTQIEEKLIRLIKEDQ